MNFVGRRRRRMKKKIVCMVNNNVINLKCTSNTVFNSIKKVHKQYLKLLNSIPVHNNNADCFIVHKTYAYYIAYSTYIFL